MQPGTMPLLAVNIGLSRRSSAWTPASLASPWAWYKFNTGITVVTGVSEWTDAWGDATKKLTQAGTTRQPALQGNGTILFDGAAATNCDGINTGVATLSQPYSYILFAKQVSWTSTRLVAASNGVGGILQTTASPEISINAGSAACNNTDWTIGTYMMVAVTVNGANSFIQVNGNAPTTGNPGANNATAFRLSQSTSGGANIQVWECIVTNAALSAGDLASAYAYGQAQGFCA